MASPRSPSQSSLALLTDLYQLTMAYAYWKSGMRRTEAVFQLSFRVSPFGGEYALAAGLEPALEFLEAFRFDDDDLAYLAGLRSGEGALLFDAAFLDALGDLALECDVDAVPEGTLVFPHEPLLRVRGPILQAQLLETSLLNQINFPTLIATKASRVCRAARGDPVLEFGLRRAQGRDGGLSASRAAYIGGCTATSNLLAGRYFGIPVRGTHAHSFVMAFSDELAAFRAYADAQPDNCVLLVDTYHSLAGVERAIEVGRALRERGRTLVGIRLDSGNLAELAGAARRRLDAAGFEKTAIVASSDLDEYAIDELKRAGAPIDIWGVGTRLATAHGEPALSGVYKLAAVREPGDAWRHPVKLSDESAKTSHPGVHQVRRYLEGGAFEADVIYDLEHPPEGQCTSVAASGRSEQRRFAEDAEFEDLLVPVVRGGLRVWDPPALEAVRARSFDQCERFFAGVARRGEGSSYPVGFELGLHRRNAERIRAARVKS